jgi:hypothetical protein
MGKLVEATHVTLGGEVGTNDWAFRTSTNSTRGKRWSS